MRKNPFYDLQNQDKFSKSDAVLQIRLLRGEYTTKTGEDLANGGNLPCTKKITIC